MDPWSMIGQGIAGGMQNGMMNPESKLHQLYKKMRFGGANPDAVNTVQQQMMMPAIGPDLGSFGGQQNPMMQQQSQGFQNPFFRAADASQNWIMKHNPFMRFL